MSKTSANNFFSSESHEGREIKLEKTEDIQELSGKTSKQQDEDKLMSSVLENDAELIKDGKLITESINQAQGSFQPDMMFKNLVTNFELAKNLYGETMIRELTGYDEEFIEKNLPVPEFRRELEKKISERIKSLKEKDLIDREGVLTHKGYVLSAAILYVEELDNLVLKGLGDKREKKKDIYGDKGDYSPYKKTRYRDIAIKQSVKTAIRRGHGELSPEDIRIFNRIKRGNIELVYALDSSGSMKGDKIKVAKQAGVALAYKAIHEKNRVGLIVFGSNIKKEVMPTDNFSILIEELAKIRAGMETDIALVLNRSLELFSKKNVTKHLIIISDALPTKGKDPESETLKAASIARNCGITISVVGINLDEEGLNLARKIVEIGDGRLYACKNLAEVDKIVLGDYYALETGGI